MIFLIIAFAIGGLAFRLGISAGWHWAAAVAVGLLPLGFTFLLGLIGLVISALFVSAIYKAM